MRKVHETLTHRSNFVRFSQLVTKGYFLTVWLQLEFRNGKRKWFDKWCQSCDFIYESRKKDPTIICLSVHSPKKYSFQLLNDRSVRNKVDFITQLIIHSNFSISAITETYLTIDDSALASQQTPICF